VDSSRFDTLAKSVASSSSRRRLLAGFLGAAVGLVASKTSDARTCSGEGVICRENANCCIGTCGAKDRTGRRRCQCQAETDCPTPACFQATCAGTTCEIAPIPAGTRCESDAGTCDQNNVCAIGKQLRVSFSPTDNLAYCFVNVELIGFEASTNVPVQLGVPVAHPNAFLTTSATGYAFGAPIGSYEKFNTFVTVTAGGLTTDRVAIAC
jgi:hypothetical protein